jgi:hypothetical protein
MRLGHGTAPAWSARRLYISRHERRQLAKKKMRGCQLSTQGISRKKAHKTKNRNASGWEDVSVAGVFADVVARLLAQARAADG